MKAQKEIVDFVQADDESLSEAWERYKELLLKCPSHNLEEWNVITIFFDGIRREFRQALNTASGGGFTSMEPGAAYDLIENMCFDANEWGGEKRSRRRGGMHEVKKFTGLEARIEAKLDAKFDALERRVANLSLVSADQNISCELCASAHH
ncbi:unnamed protein product [Linum trigynum]|uniref:Retrotransposon gag domain-containing protein n=1 Tax=Linum trigynum TaxID=586398 RepID=A0AAV2DD13_9ROSI